MNQSASLAVDLPRAPGPRGWLGARNLLHFATNQLTWIRDLADQHGDVVGLSMLGRPWFLVSHPDDIEAVLVKHARVMKRDDYSRILERALGLGLLTSDGELWKRQRRLMSQAFVPSRIQSYAGAMVRVTLAALGGWRHGEAINLHQEMSRVTMEVVAEVLFGAGVGETDGETVRQAMEVINEFFANSPEAIARLPAWVPTPRNRRMTHAVAQIDELIYRIIARRRAGEPRDDLLGTLLSAQDDDGTKMSDRQLRDEAVTLFLAGHETTALALAHTLYLLSKHPDVERKLHAELTSVLGDRPLTGADVKLLPYAERVLKESMRLFPPAWTTGREAAERVEIGGFEIPKGAQILVSQWVVHRDPRWFPNPEGFDPDRWAPERTRDLPRFAYFPFGGGPRVCIGNHFAMMEATLILALIVRDWRLELLPGQRLELKPSVTLRQKGPGLRVRLAERAALANRPPAHSWHDGGMTSSRQGGFALALAVIASLGCGGTVTTETSGTGGSGGSTTGGAGGTGGVGTGGDSGTCSLEERAHAYDSPPPLGLQSPPGSPLSAVVTSVSATLLEYTLGPDAPVDSFLFGGPGLDLVFQQGDIVNVGTSEGWHYVTGNNQVAATYTTYQFVPPDALPAVPMTKSPPIGFATQCAFPEAEGACGLPPASVEVLELRVGKGSDAESVPVGSSKTIGSFTLYNAQSVALPGYGSSDCVLEALFMTGVTALGPIGK